jgi:cytochrome c-type biogenesis protein CcmH
MNAADAAATPPARPGARLIALSALFVLGVACAGYWWTGTPAALSGAPQTAPSTANADEAAKVAEFTGMVDKLRERMDKEPAAEGLAMLGRSYLVLGRPDDAVAAYQRALKIEPQNASFLADMADATGVKNGNSLSGAPMAFVEQALRIDPKNLKALMLAGSEAFDRNDHASALRYWQRMNEAGPADHPLVKQAGQAIQETQRVMAASSSPTAAAPASGVSTAPGFGIATPAASAASAVNASISGQVALATAIKDRASPEDTVFIFARPAEGSRMPLAILRKQVKDLPMVFKLDDSLSMSPAVRLSSASRVIVGARVSKSGNPMPQPGDLEVLSEPVAVGTTGLKLEISQAVR